ncbi:peptidoglycan-recognition protein SB1-like [Eurosta solidaginis]|uniref:peptidoglycan-recognition protein SB1-like n=1 Tax=Eurosta solidaginis TaxID=178769 RepID=UPI003530DB69
MTMKYLLAVLLTFQNGIHLLAVPATKSEVNWNLIQRNGWGARPAKESEANFKGSAPFLILHHSYVPSAAYTNQDCIAAMQYIQNLHMDTNGWSDIGYSFAICGDSNVYVGRGYNVIGSHAPNYNSRSIGLLLIGDYVAQLPTQTMLAVTHDFIDYSVKTGNLQEDYILYGHRQVRGTECPGAALYAEIQTWPNWQEVEQHNHVTTNAIQGKATKLSLVLTITTIVLLLPQRFT